MARALTRRGRQTGLGRLHFASGQAVALRSATGAWSRRAVIATTGVGLSALMLHRRNLARCEVHEEDELVPCGKRTAQRAPMRKCLLRLAHVIWNTLPIMILYPLCRLVDAEWLWRYYQSFCIAAVRRIGASATKLAQWVASRKDLFGEEILSLLPPELHTDAQASNATEEDLLQVRRACAASGTQLSEEEPLCEVGSGCVANVFRARKVDGQAVVVKIVRKGVKETMQADLVVLSWLMAFAHRLNPELRPLCLDEALAEFCVYLQLQTDLIIEARNLMRMRRNFEGSAHIKFPEVHGTPTEDLIVQSYVEGQHMSEFLRQDPELRNQQERKLISLELGRAFCKMLFIDNLTHLDLHPGNIKVNFTGNPLKRPFEVMPEWLWQRLPQLTAVGLNDPAEKNWKWELPLPVLALFDMCEAKWAKITGSSAFELWIYDTGMVLTVDAEKQRLMKQACSAAVQGDGNDAGRQLLEAHTKWNRVGASRAEDREKFVTEIGELLVAAVLYADNWEKFFTNFDDYVLAGTAEYLSMACNLFRMAKVRMDPEMYCAIASIALVEGSMRACFKECSIARCALPFLVPGCQSLHRVSYG